MKNILLIAGALALGTAGQAVAKPGNGKGHGQSIHKSKAGQHGLGGTYGYGRGGCPPGLAKKNPPCVPPGQAKRQFAVGQRVPYGYNGMTPYGALPYDLRSQYDLDPYSNYIYRDDYLYQVDPRTMIVQQILRAIL